MPAGTGNLVVNVDVTSAHTDIQKMGVLGDRTLQGGVEYTLVYAPSTIAANLVLVHSTHTDSSDYYVIAAAASTDVVAGINATPDEASIAASSNFWMAVGGMYGINSDSFGAAVGAGARLAIDTDFKIISMVSNAAMLLSGVTPFGHAVKAIITSTATDQSVFLNCHG